MTVHKTLLLLFTLSFSTQAQATNRCNIFRSADLREIVSKPEYRELSSNEKQGILFDLSSEKPYSQAEMDVQKDPGARAMLSLLRPSTLVKSFTHRSDQRDIPVEKRIHTYGSVAKVILQIYENSLYTGLFAGGQVLGIIRLSLAQRSPPYTPGFALKLFVEGNESANIFSMDSLEGQGNNHNFFENNFKTKIDPPTTFAKKLLARSFRKALSRNLNSEHADETLQSVRSLAKVTPLGERVDHPFMPASLIFRAKVQMSSEPGDLRQRLNNSSQYSEGIILYEVLAQAEFNGPAVPLGQIVLTSSFVSNLYGDQQLFFRHNID